MDLHLHNQGLREINETTALSFSSTFNQGSINPQYTSASNKRSGLPNTYNYTGTAYLLTQALVSK